MTLGALPARPAAATSSGKSPGSSRTATSWAGPPRAQRGQRGEWDVRGQPHERGLLVPSVRALQRHQATRGCGRDPVGGLDGLARRRRGECGAQLGEAGADAAGVLSGGQSECLIGGLDRAIWLAGEQHGLGEGYPVQQAVARLAVPEQAQSIVQQRDGLLRPSRLQPGAASVGDPGVHHPWIGRRRTTGRTCRRGSAYGRNHRRLPLAVAALARRGMYPSGTAGESSGIWWASPSVPGFHAHPDISRRTVSDMIPAVAARMVRADSMCFAGLSA